VYNIFRQVNATGCLNTEFNILLEENEKKYLFFLEAAKHLDYIRDSIRPMKSSKQETNSCGGVQRVFSKNKICPRL
jgi:hypothetical protein